MGVLICPKCKKQLNRLDNTYKCENNHSYDISKRGYVNLLLANQMNSLNPGDNKEMMEARKKFLSSGYYERLRHELAEIIKKYNKNIILDLGCGEGYYTSFFANNDNLSVYGLDISKAMINEASKEMKKYNNLTYFIASTNNVPIDDCSIDAIVNCFAPLDIEEAKRVLKDDGILIKVVPDKNHLYELKKILYDNPYVNDDPAIISGVNLIEKKNLTCTIELTSYEDIYNLFMMTPYYYKTSKRGTLKLKAYNMLTVTIDFEITIYHK